MDYLIEGNGQPAIVIGFPTYYPRVFSRELRSHLKLVFVDHRGSAPCPGPTPVSQFSLDKISDDIELIRTTLDLGKVAIIGHSGHALMALEYAKRYPDSVSHVVMIGIAPNFGPANTAARDEYWDRTASVARKKALERNWEGHESSADDEGYPGEGFIQTYVRNGPMAWYDHDFDATPLWRGVEINMDMFDHVWGNSLSKSISRMDWKTSTGQFSWRWVGMTIWWRRHPLGIQLLRNLRIWKSASTRAVGIRLHTRSRMLLTKIYSSG